MQPNMQLVFIFLAQLVLVLASLAPASVLSFSDPPALNDSSISKEGAVRIDVGDHLRGAVCPAPKFTEIVTVWTYLTPSGSAPGTTTVSAPMTSLSSHPASGSAITSDTSVQTQSSVPWSSISCDTSYTGGWHTSGQCYRHLHSTIVTTPTTIPTTWGCRGRKCYPNHQSTSSPTSSHNNSILTATSSWTSTPWIPTTYTPTGTWMKHGHGRM